MRRLIPVLLSVGLLASGGMASAEERRPLVRIDDAAGDDRGRGSYTYPARRVDYRSGDFDLRRFEVLTEGEDVLFRVTFARALLKPDQPRRTKAIIIPLDNNIYVQNVDIYIQSDVRPGAGHATGVPGRKIAFGPLDQWQKAVVLTPQPYVVKSLLTDWRPLADVHFATGLEQIGRTVTARVPKAVLGGEPEAHWGYGVVVSGALWEQRFHFTDGPLRRELPNALTMPVATVASWRRFGGGDPSGFHPNVIDLLAPPNRNQYRILSDSDADRRRYAQLPLVRPDPLAYRRAVEALTSIDATGTQTLRVEAVEEDLIVLEGDGVLLYQIGELEDGRRVVVVARYPEITVVRVVSGNGPAVRPGDVVRFRRGQSADSAKTQ